jgi:uncharacterized membrane-anchored protein YitT (DUF2179 family)
MFNKQQSGWLRTFWDYVFITLGCALIAWAVVGFFQANTIAPGGVSGISVILYKLFQFPLEISYLAINLPLFIMGMLLLGKSFGFKTFYGTVMISVFLRWIPGGAMTENVLLAALIGGGLTGSGLGLVFSRGATTGGTDLFAAILNRFFPTVKTQHFLLFIDGCVVVTSGLVSGQIETALLSVVALMTVVKLVDAVLDGFLAAKAFWIITDRPEPVSERILAELDRGATMMSGKGAYTQGDKGVLLCVVERYEIVKMRRIVKEVDPRSFMIVADVHEVYGEGFTEQ